MKRKERTAIALKEIVKIVQSLQRNPRPIDEILEHFNLLTQYVPEWCSIIYNLKNEKIFKISSFDSSVYKNVKAKLQEIKNSSL